MMMMMMMMMMKQAYCKGRFVDLPEKLKKNRSTVHNAIPAAPNCRQ